MTDSRLVFLTGATGFIGGRLAAALHARGDRLRCLVRDPSRAQALSRLGAELVPGDVTDEAVLARGLEGADLAYHLAAIYDIGAVDRQALQRSNVAGTRAFLAALRAAGTRLGVYVSTTAALGPVAEGEGDEDSRYAGPFPTVYHETKTRAHELALAAGAEGASLVIVCPAYVYGPGDHGPAGRFLLDLLAGRIPALLRDPAWFSFVYVDDVVSGLVSAGEVARASGVYVLSGEPATINDFAERAGRLAGVRVPRLRFPVAVARFTGALLDPVSRLTGRRFSISRESVASATRHRWLHGHARATRDFAWEPRPLAEGLPSTVAWAKRELEARQ